MEDHADIGILGGTGVYDPEMLQNSKRIKVYTPYGATSEVITIGTYAGKQVAFLPRHGEEHSQPPHKLPFRANLWALKELGVTRIISPSAVGGLCKKTEPGDFVFPDQFFDWTKTREYTFYDGGQVCHVSTAEPFCPELRALAIKTTKQLGIKHHPKGTALCIEGPRFSTKAESIFFRDGLKATTIGMNLVPECTLARELEICFLPVAMVTDYDAWHDEPVDNAMVLRAMKKNSQTLRKLLTELIPKIPLPRENCDCPHAIENAVM